MAQSRKPGKRAAKRRHTVNMRLLVVSSIVVVVVGVAGFGWHTYRQSQLSDKLLDRAKEFKKAEDWDKAAEYYQRLLVADPSNTEALTNFVRAYSKGELSNARRYRLVQLLYRALGRDPDVNFELRAMLVENLWHSKELEEAAKQASPLIGKTPDAGDEDEAAKQRASKQLASIRKAEKFAAMAKYRLAQIDPGVSKQDAIDKLLATVEQLPDDAELVEFAAEAIRDNPTLVETGDISAAELADQLIERMVAESPNDIDARLARYRYRSKYLLPGGQDDLDKALAIDPENVDAIVLHAASQSVSQMDDEQHKAVEDSLRKAIELAPLDSRAYLILANVFSKTDRNAQAVDLLRKGGEATGFTLEFNIRVANEQLARGELDEAKATVAALLRDSTVYLANKDSETRSILENDLTLLQSRLDIALDNTGNAKERLETLLLTSESFNDENRRNQWMQAADLLARLAEVDGRWDQVADYRNQIAEKAPDLALAVELAASSRMRVGDSRGVIRLIEDFATRSETTEEMQILLLQAHLASQLARPPRDQIWGEFDRALQIATSNANGRWEPALAEANALIAKGEADAAANTLRAAEEEFSDNVEFWRLAVITYRRLGDDTADDLARALERHGELADTPIQHARLTVTALVQGGRIKEARNELERLIESADSEERLELARLRAELLAGSGDFDAALSEYSKLIEDNPDELSLLQSAAELAIRGDDFDLAELWTTRLLERRDDDQSRYIKNLLLVRRYSGLSGSEQERLEREIGELRGSRPRWSKAAALSGDLARAKGDDRQALIEYGSAVDFGDRSASTLQKLISILYASGRFAEANEYLHRMTSSNSADPFVNAMSLQMALSQNRIEDAIAIAQQAVEQRSDDAIARIQLANLLVRGSRPDEALRVLREAAQEFRDDDRVWTALFSTMVRTGKRDEAQELLTAILGSEAMPSERKHEIAAQGYQLVGNSLEARRQFELALGQQPSRVDLRLKYAQLLFSVAPASARREYETILQVEPENRPAKRGLATLLAATGRQADWERSNSLLQELTSGSSSSADDDRLRAMLLVNKGRTRAEKIQNCRLAAELLESLAESDSERANLINRRLLAQVIERQARLADEESLLLEAQEQWKSIADDSNVAAEQLSAYCDFLIRHVRTDSLVPSAAEAMATSDADLRRPFVDEAEKRIEQLAQLSSAQPVQIEQLAIVLTAKLRLKCGDVEQARKSVDAYAARFESTQDLQDLQTIGQMYASIDAHADAERWFRQMTEVNPNAYLLVVQSLIAQDKRREAADLALEMIGPDPSPEEAAVLANILTSPGEEPEEAPQADAAIAAAIESSGDQLSLLQAAAVMKASRGDYDEAIVLFRRIIELDPENALALNNLATLLAERPNQLAEALERIGQAIAISGRLPMLLDTQGTIYLKLKDAERAIDCLEEATAGGIPDARYYLHLAVAYELDGRSADAAAALQESRQLGLERFVLTADDRELLRDLEAAIDPTAEPN